MSFNPRGLDKRDIIMHVDGQSMSIGGLNAAIG